jgi:hypothetical protein
MYADETASYGMIYSNITSFIKIGTGVQTILKCNVCITDGRDI